MGQRRHPSWQSFPFLATMGALFGILNSAFNHGMGTPYAAKLIGNAWGWLAVGLAACWAGHLWKSAFGRGITFLIPAVLAYYTSDSLAGVYTTRNVQDPTVPTGFDFSNALSDSFFYVVLGTLTAAGLGMLVVLIRRGGVVGLLASIAVPGYITWDAWRTQGFLSHDAWPSRDPVLLRVTSVLWPVSLGVTVVVLLMWLWRLWLSINSSADKVHETQRR